jgi:Tol biopolymer transport system component
VVRVSQTGGKWHPRYGPDGRQLAFSTPDSDALGPRGLRILDLATKEERHVFPYGLYPSWSPDGKRFVFTGWVYEDGRWVGGSGGSLVAVDASGANPEMIQYYPSGGGVESPSFSPDGGLVLFREPYFVDAGVGQIWVVHPDGGGAKRLTKKGGRWPCWSPDGKKVVYTRVSYDAPTQEGSGDLYIMDADGSRERRLTFFDFNKQ